MLLKNLMRNRKFRPAGRRLNGSRGRSRLAVEPLEHRLLLTTILSHDQLLGGSGDAFGDCVAFCDDIAVVGAPLDDAGGLRDSGSAVIYERSDPGTPSNPTDDTWSEVTTLYAADPETRAGFGSAVAVCGSDAKGYTIAVGAWKEDVNARDSGAVYVFTGSGESWSFAGKLAADDGERSDSFGHSNTVSIYRAPDPDTAETIAVGAPYHGNSGAAYVFTPGTSGWSTPIQYALDPGSLPSSAMFGRSVAIGADTIAVGAHDAGIVCVFDRDETPGGWTKTAELTRWDGNPLGWDVDISDTGDTIVAGSMWRVFSFAGGAGAWRNTVAQEGDRLMPDSPDPSGIRFGWSLDLCGDTVVVGAASDPEKVAYVFEGSGTAWQQTAELSLGTLPFAGLGSGVATDGTTALVSDKVDDIVLLFATDAREATPGITVSPTSDLETTENGGTATFTVKLDTEPAEGTTVTIDVTSSEPLEGTVDPAQLTFDSTTWSTAQTVTVSGVDDSIIDGDFVYTITLDPSGSSAADYAGLTPIEISASNFDNDSPPIADPGGPYTVVEGGSVVLDASNSTDPDLPYDVLTYEWDLDYDGITFDVDATGPTTTFHAGTLTANTVVDVAVRVTDTAPNSIVAQTTVTVEEASAELTYSSTHDPIRIGDLKTVTSTVLAVDSDVVTSLLVEIFLTHDSVGDLSAALISPSDDQFEVPGPFVSGTPNEHAIGLQGATPTLNGTWTLEVTDNVKNRKRGSLIEWTLVVNRASTPAAADAAMAALAELDSAADDDVDSIDDSLAADLALMVGQ